LALWVFEPIINLGAVISVIATMAAAVGFVWVIKSSVAVLAVRLDMQDRAVSDLETEIKKLSGVVIDIAVQKQELAAMEQRSIMQGKRLDDITRRLDRWLDKKVDD
jgi:hypothetical protein